ncbi:MULTISPECIES: class I SAM-dependent methyltransferase [unclassified Flavobacterium]|uniref:class I SAM-dependent methyltransferase n=1 Tax=unclassified Flavobacterium TaxID=196869 RepID=UPI003619C467
MKKPYSKIISHYEKCLEIHGDNHLGVDWPKIEDVDKRYKVMLDIIKFDEQNLKSPTVLDFGCGTAHLLEYIIKNQYQNIQYSGLDISQKFVDIAQKKFPTVDFYCCDIFETKSNMPTFDYIVMNGVFTEKRELTFDQMWDYFTKLIILVYEKASKGIAFNVMSKSVEWEREDLFHVPHDLLSEFLCKNLTRNYIIRNDYGLYEYTVYVLKK